MQSFSTFIPPERTLMGPGPSDVNPRILNAMARPTLGQCPPSPEDVLITLNQGPLPEI